MQTPEGAEKLREIYKNTELRQFMAEIGRKGGKVKNPNKGFGSNPELARQVGARGGRISRRGKKHEE